MKYETRAIKVIVGPVGEPIFDERVTFVEIDDEATGEFVRVTQSSEHKGIALSPDEWPTIRDAIESMVKKCREKS